MQPRLAHAFGRTRSNSERPAAYTPPTSWRTPCTRPRIVLPSERVVMQTTQSPQFSYPARPSSRAITPSREPKHVARGINVGRSERVVSALLGGAALLQALRRPTPASAAFVLGGGALLHRSITGHCYVYRALGRDTTQQGASTRARTEFSLTIEKPAAELYRAWRDPQHVALAIGDFARIETLPDGRWRWHIGGPGKRGREWTTRVEQEVPNELIRWRTEPDAPFEHHGWVRFQPAPRDWGTVVTLSLGFGAPGGPLSMVQRMLPKLPKTLEERVLRRSKQLCVAGEIATLDKNPSARKRSAPSRTLTTGA